MTAFSTGINYAAESLYFFPRLTVFQSTHCTLLTSAEFVSFCWKGLSSDCLFPLKSPLSELHLTFCPVWQQLSYLWSCKQGFTFPPSCELEALESSHPETSNYPTKQESWNIFSSWHFQAGESLCWIWNYQGGYNIQYPFFVSLSLSKETIASAGIVENCWAGWSVLDFELYYYLLMILVNVVVDDDENSLKKIKQDKLRWQSPTGTWSESTAPVLHIGAKLYFYVKKFF